MLTTHLALFFSALLAATILPFSSEVFLYALLQGEEGWTVKTLLTIAVATLGNVLGACINWWLGKELLRFRHHRWFYFDDKQIARAQAWFQRYGVWSLLLSWVPVVGDPLTLIAGFLRVRFALFLLLVAVGKLLRYLVIAALAV
ncbi:MAG: YqaA family protein [Pseudomonadota bacterium]